MSNIFSFLQRIGKALMLPVAVLPAAALLLRLGAPDVFNVPFVTNAGGAIFSNLPLIFAIGIAIGLAKGEAGAAGLSGAIGYLTLTEGIKTFDSSLNMGVFGGIVAGISAGLLYNRYHTIKLPEFLGFFSGSRFVPIVTCAHSLVFALIFGNIWGFFQNLTTMTGEWIISTGAFGAFVFGILNRALLPIGLHHILNSIMWFICGEYITDSGTIATGDLNRFFAGDPTAGIFMAGFFPIMMFALPAVALAIYHTANKDSKKEIGGMLLSLALTSFLTGITEPLEYSFMFLAPILYGVHAILTGVSLAVTHALGVLHGFGFSAGFIDYVLNYGLATNPLLIIPIGLVFAAIYYVVFRYAIIKFDLKTPGRLSVERITESITEINDNIETAKANELESNLTENAKIASDILKMLGGNNNIKSLTNCVTRLRVEVEDSEKVDTDSIKQLRKIKGVMKNGSSLQIIIGTEVEDIAREAAKIREQ